MVTVATIVHQIERDFLISIVRPEYDTIDTTYNTSTSNIVLDATETLLPGAILNAGFELMYVKSYNPDTRTASVIRGFLGTTAASGNAGDMIRINPRFSDAAIMDAITEELRDWDERLFTVQRESLSVGPSDIILTATPTRKPYRLLAMRLRPAATSSYTGYPAQYKYLAGQLRTNEASTVSSTGYAIHLESPVPASTTVDVYYALPFDTSSLTSSTDLVSTTGLSTTMLEVLKWGALYRLMAGRETVRADPGAVQRPDLAQAVPAGLQVQAAESYRRMRDRKYNEEAKRLLAEWPVRFY